MKETTDVSLGAVRERERERERESYALLNKNSFKNICLKKIADRKSVV